MESLRILCLNWRCIRNPEAGGAEIYTHMLLGGFSKLGHEVFLLTSRVPGLPIVENISGYTVVRCGNKFTVYSKAYMKYLKYFKGKVDVVVDEVNTIPFLTPVYVHEPIIMFIHQLAGKAWFYHTPPPIALAGYVFEPVLLSPYRKARVVVTVSESSKRSIEGIVDGNRVSIVKPAPSIHKPKVIDKAEYPQTCYIGRVVPYKRIEDQILAARLVSSKVEGYKHVIAGRGWPKYLRKLKQMALKLGLNGVVEIKGEISKEEKIELLSSSWLFIYTSYGEGYGIAGLDAATCGTPVIAYRTRGLVDLANDTGALLVDMGDINGLADTIMLLLRNHELRDKISRRAQAYTEKWSWREVIRAWNRLVLDAAS